MSQQLIAENLKNLLKICPVEKIQIFNKEIVLVVKPYYLTHLLKILKKHVLYQFEILTCISGVDYPQHFHRFKLVYELLSIRYNCRIRVKTFTNELIGVNSCDKLFLTAGWYECEIWDMFGVFFNNHTNLKRILTDYGFEGYPLRKDFPLSGFIEVRYHEIQKRIINEPLEMAQEYRNFTFLSPWKTVKL
uniref:NADH dehydrogenase subunit 9 n=1 Tax=Lithodesmium undulatum TaxID=59812 RepID=A0A7T6UZP8_LITUN|nr:NADH dehydrogenase subunit 9 [Lithodesmium undulatum]QQJ94668.1 NADH dehydrogenase subunit 9 [Lithodesmium undulatum]